MEKRKRRSQAEMVAARNNAVKASLAVSNEMQDPDEGDSEGKDSLAASFVISDGKDQLRVKALKDCWAIQRWSFSKNKKTGEDESGWNSFKYVTDLGSIANRIFNMRLKNSEVTTLKELSAAAIQIGEDIRKDFKFPKATCICTK